ncbi:MAG: hypothetical protein IJL26_11050 [Clostridia bacterium]|nr:hypothetical protein [Clostridia bacterium]
MAENALTAFRVFVNVFINLMSIVAQISPRDEMYKYFAHPESMFLHGKIIRGEDDGN